MKFEATFTTVTLSRGSGWVWRLRGKPGDYWPDSGTATIIFYESTGAVIATLEGEMTKLLLSFEYEESAVELIPHGAGFELFVTPDDTGLPQLVRYGNVTRKEVRFPDAPAVDLSDTAMYYGDKFERGFLGPKWITKGGRPTLYNGTLGTVDQAFVTNERAAVLFYSPLNGDDCTINVKFANVGDGYAGMLFCADYSMSSFLGFFVKRGSFLWSTSNTVHIVRAYRVGDGPFTFERMTNVSSSTSANDNFLIKFNSQTDTVNVYKNDSTTALTSWTDSDHTVPHGEGFRYLGCTFYTGAIFSTGPRIQEWSAKDGL